jgi:Icc-related predicted phosphoesterase
MGILSFFLMKILAFVDMHGSLKALKKLHEKVMKQKPDLIICAGDFTVFEQNMDYIIHRFSKWKVPVLIVHGNHEDVDVLEHATANLKNVMFMHGKTYNYDHTIFLGHGGGGFSLRDKDFEKATKEFEKKMAGFEKVVLFTHAPPYKTKLDKIMDSYCGCKSIRNFIKKHNKKIVVAISGHLHENSGKEDKIGKTRLVNPSPYGKIIWV